MTARGYLDMVRPFVQGRLSADCRALNLERLAAADIISFVVTRCPRHSRGAAKLTVTALRSFLGFLHLDGVIEGSSLSAVPSVAGRRLVGLPKGLAPDQVRRLFAAHRATIGLDRDDFDVICGALTIRNGKFGKSRELPLHPSTNSALAAYLGRADRPHQSPNFPVNVKRWQNTAIDRRSIMEAAEGFRRLKPYKQLPVVRATLDATAAKRLVVKRIGRQADAA